MSEDTVNYSTKYSINHYKIQVNDNIQVIIRSNNRQAATPYNVIDPNNPAALGGEFLNYLNGYSVSDSGMIDLPNLGKVKVSGLTTNEVKIKIMKEMEKYLNDAFVTVKLSGINYTVLGEVNKPNKYLAYRNQLTIFEAIADAGDLKEIANRRSVKMLRQYPDGIKTFTIDLTDREIIKSPYYFLQPNDVIYVQPLKIRSLGVGTTGFSTIQGVITILSIVVLVFTLTRK